MMGRKKKPEPIPEAVAVVDRTPEVLSAIRAESEGIASGHGCLLRSLDAMHRDHAQRIDKAEQVLREAVNAIAGNIRNRETVEGLRAKANDGNMATLAEKFNAMVEEVRLCRIDVLAVQEDVAEFKADTDLRFKMLADLLEKPARLKISIPDGFKLTPVKR